MKVILLEDEYLLNANVKEYLELKGMVVESYTDGGELLQTCSLEADMAILDIQTPGATGYEVLEWIKRVNPKTPTIFMSAYTDIQTLEKGTNWGARTTSKNHSISKSCGSERNNCLMARTRRK